MKLTYSYIKIQKSTWFNFINFISSISIHFIIFVLLNTIPNISTNTASWNQIQTVKKQAGNKNWARGIEVINMIPSDEIKINESKVKDTGKPKKEGKLGKAKLGKVKGKHSFSPKISMTKKEEPQMEKLISEKNAAKSQEKKQPKKVIQIPNLGTERGVRSITDKSPLSSPPSANVGNPSKKSGDKEGSKNQIDQKAVSKTQPKEEIKPEKKIAEPKKIDIKKLPIPEPKILENIAKKIEPLKTQIQKKMFIEDKIKPQTTQPIKPAEEIKKPLAELDEKKIIEKIKEIEKIEEIKKQDMTTVKEKMPEPEKLVRETISEISQKGKIAPQLLTQVGMTPKKMSLGATKMLAGDRIREIATISPDQDKAIGKTDVQNQLKLGSSAGTFENKIKDSPGDANPILFANKGNENFAKNTPPPSDLKFEEKESFVQSQEESEKISAKMIRTLTQDTILKQRSSIEPVIPREPKRIKIASVQKEEELFKKETKVQEEQLKEILKPGDKIGTKDALQKMLEQVREEAQKEEEKRITKVLDSTNLEDFPAYLSKEELNKDSNLIGNKNIIASGDKGEAVQTIKFKRTLDRNPMSVTKRTPLTRVATGGSTRRVIREDISQEDMKKIEKYIEKVKKLESSSGSDGGGFLFEPIIKQFDIEALLFKKEERADAGGSVGDKKEQSDFIDENTPVSEKEKMGSSVKENIDQSNIFGEKEAFAQIGMGFEPGDMGVVGKLAAGKGTFGLKEKQIGEMDRQFKDIAAYSKAKFLSMDKGGFPKISSVAHDATRTLGKKDELVVTMQGDSGESASFDIGLYRTEIHMNEISPGIYKGIYRIVEGDNVSDATIVGYLMNKENKQSSMAATTTVSIDTSPGITIATPQRDITVDKAIQTITGVVDDPEVKNIVLSLNGNMRNVPVENGFFNADVELVKGKNVIEVMAVNSKGDIGRDKMDLTYATYKVGPKITINSPTDGNVINVADSPIIEVHGTISDFSISKAKLTVNEIPLDITVQDGEFNQKVVLFSPENSFSVQAINAEGTIGISEPVIVKTTGLGHFDAILNLNWDGQKADLDLVLKNATGKFISHKSPSIDQNPNAIPGGRLELDDTEGFGPEVITLRQATAGLYSVHVNYYEGNGDKTINASVSIILTDPNDPSKSSSKIFGPKTMNVGEEWKVIFIGIPEMRFYSIE